MSGLRILLVSLRFPPYVLGGYELLAHDSAQRLREAGHEVEVLCGRGERFEDPRVHPVLEPSLDPERDLFEESFRASNLARYRLHVHNPANLRATTEAIERFRPDLLLAFNLGLVSLAPLRAARRARIPTLIQASDLWPTNHWLREWRERGNKRVRRELLERWWRGPAGGRRLGPMLTPSRFLAERLAEGGVPRETVEVAYLGVPQDAWERGLQTAPRPREAGERLRVLCASMLWEGKGQHVLLEAACAAVELGADLEIELAGGGEPGYRERLERIAGRQALRGRARLLGNLPRSGVLDRFAAAHVVVVPSLWGEPFALVPLEAQAMGCALVATRDGGTPELVRHGETGLLVEPDDSVELCEALVSLATGEPRRRALAAAGQAYVREHFPTNLYPDRLERRCREVVAAARGGA